MKSLSYLIWRFLILCHFSWHIYPIYMDIFLETKSELYASFIHFKIQAEIQFNCKTLTF